MPTRHCLHDVEPLVSAYVPASQLVHKEELGSEAYNPTRHCVQAVELVFSAYVPGSQGVHASELLFPEKKPIGQLWHVEALDSLENVPAGHASWAEEPGGQ